MFSESENVLVSPCGIYWGGGGFSGNFFSLSYLYFNVIF